LREQVAVTDCFRNHFLESDVSRGCDRIGQRLAERALELGSALQQHLQGQFIKQLRGGGFVEHIEARPYIGLEWKLMQEARAEGMDRLHFQSARRLKRVGK